MASLDLIGSSTAFRTLPDNIEMIAPADSAVLSQGEAGTGKGVIARGIREVGVRYKSCFVESNCATLPNALETELFSYENESPYLPDEIRKDHDFDEIIGNSPQLLKLLDRVQSTAPTDANVLIIGETGSGKELIARAIHSRGARKNSPLVKVNCGAIPSGLVESELFGHVKGAFTSASDRRIGRFELANSGTLFLDEAGELPLETQVKLLRVLQEQEFEPVGSSPPT